MSRSSYKSRIEQAIAEYRGALMTTFRTKDPIAIAIGALGISGVVVMAGLQFIPQKKKRRKLS